MLLSSNARWHGQTEDASSDPPLKKVERTVTDANASSKKITVHADASHLQKR